MQNFPFVHNGQTLWYARSMAVVALIYTKIGNDTFFLLNKRGKGSPDFVGKWNFPCGFMDFDESAIDCATRETYEECGFEIDLYGGEWEPHTLNTNPASSSNQTLSLILRREVKLTSLSELKKLNETLKPTGGEEDEVDDIKWFSMQKLMTMKEDLAFNHYDITVSFEKYKKAGFTLK